MEICEVIQVEGPLKQTAIDTPSVYLEPKKYPYKTDYYRKFKESHNVNQKVICEICGGSYSYYCKSNHNKSKKHQIALLVNQPEKLAEYLKIKKTP